MFSIQRNRKLLKAAAAVLSALCIMAVSILAGPAVTALADENITVDGTVTDKTSDMNCRRPPDAEAGDSQ